jgi:hypothetical protein
LPSSSAAERSRLTSRRTTKPKQLLNEIRAIQAAGWETVTPAFLSDVEKLAEAEIGFTGKLVQLAEGSTAEHIHRRTRADPGGGGREGPAIPGPRAEETG